jgi:hypothetical protein
MMKRDNLSKKINFSFFLLAAQRYRTQSGPAPASIRPFGSGSSDEDPYSVAGSGSSGSSGGNNIIHHTPGRAQIPPPSKSAVQVRKVSLFCSEHNFFVSVRYNQAFAETSFGQID